MVDLSELGITQEKKRKLKLATVTSLNENGTAIVTFFGEDEESQKGYSYLACYTPAEGDTVLMIPFADTYIIGNKIMLQTDIPVQHMTVDEVNELINSAMGTYVSNDDLTAALSLYALTADLETNHTHDTLKYTGGGTANGSSVGLKYISDGNRCFAPSTSDYIKLGGASWKWKEIYASTGTINTSDKRMKNSIDKMSSKYETFFMNIMPVIYKFNKNDSDRLHVGFISQDIEKALKKSGLTSKDFAGFIKAKAGSGKYEYGLRYNEFIPLNTHMIQQLIKRAEKSEKKAEAFEKRIEDLEKQMKALEEKLEGR